jgi:hypothetical protein
MIRQEQAKQAMLQTQAMQSAKEAQASPRPNITRYGIDGKIVGAPAAVDERYYLQNLGYK